MKTTQQITDERFNLVIKKINNMYKATAYNNKIEFWAEYGKTYEQAHNTLLDSLDTLFLNQIFN